jgi:hypothetical protein
LTHVDCLHPKTPLIDIRTGLPTKFFSRWLYCIWSRTGGDDDIILNLQTDASLEQVSDNNTFVNNLSNRVNLLELANELTPTTSRIIELEKKIKELEIKIETLTAYNDTLISDRLQAVEIKMEMNYGA